MSQHELDTINKIDLLRMGKDAQKKIRNKSTSIPTYANSFEEKPAVTNNFEHFSSATNTSNG